jgi:hypothetical protein
MPPSWVAFVEDEEVRFLQTEQNRIEALQITENVSEGALGSGR